MKPNVPGAPSTDSISEDASGAENTGQNTGTTEPIPNNTIPDSSETTPAGLQTTPSSRGDTPPSGSSNPGNSDADQQFLPTSYPGSVNSPYPSNPDDNPAANPISPRGSTDQSDPAANPAADPGSTLKPTTSGAPNVDTPRRP